jgi:hypothetical protein
MHETPSRDRGGGRATGQPQGFGPEAYFSLRRKVVRELRTERWLQMHLASEITRSRRFSSSVGVTQFFSNLLARVVKCPRTKSGRISKLYVAALKHIDKDGLLD